MDNLLKDTPRPCVGVVLVNDDKKVFVAKRLFKAKKDDPYWQMPQGGIDSSESPEVAMQRELEEETGISKDSIDIIAESKQWYTYEIPKDMQKRHFGAQTQKWFLVKFKGNEDEIDLSSKHPEFSEWKWTSFRNLPKIVIEFKRDVYKKVVKDFEWYFEN